MNNFFPLYVRKSIIIHDPLTFFGNRFETYSSSCTYLCNFITIAQIYQNFRFFGILPVFLHIGHSDLRFETYSSSCSYLCIFITIAQLDQNHRFFGIFPVKKTLEMLIWDSKSTLQAALMCAISIEQLNSIKITGFSAFNRFLKKKYRKFWHFQYVTYDIWHI